MEFILGCNYWASDSGTEMWKTFNVSAIKKDLSILSEYGVKHIRVFPNWRDFQPVMPMMRGAMSLYEYCLEGDKPKTNPYYLDDTMMDRFREFLKLCEEYNIKVIVGLITGWMSGRMFVPPVLYQSNIINDPLSQYFQQLFIKGFVSRFKSSKTILAWDLGNECNCMSITDRINAVNWTSMIANAIRAEDNSRPIISGMHSLDVERNKTWRIEDQAMFTDMLTTHPYALWCEHTRIDKALSLRTTMHATAQTKLYAEIGNKPCMAEEIGTMGPMYCSNENAASFFRLNMFSLWANNSSGVMWWCANDQTMLESFPYSENMVELELGMLYKDHTPKPVLLEMKRFSEFLDNKDFELPKADVDAVCVLTDNQRQWGVAYMTYILLKQVGLNCSFAYADSDIISENSKDEIPDSPLYILPSINSMAVMKKKRYEELKRRVYDGADIYISMDNGCLAEFEEFTGLRIEDSYEHTENSSLNIGDEEIAFERHRTFILKPVGAEVIAYDKNNNPSITVNRYGKGRVFFVNFPLEDNLIDKHNAFGGNVHLIYEKLFGEYTKKHPITVANQNIAVTYHKTENGFIVVLINHSDETCKPEYVWNSNGKIKKVHYGSMDEIKPYDACIFELEA